jgi:hypothetical protein
MVKKVSNKNIKALCKEVVEYNEAELRTNALNHAIALFSGTNFNDMLVLKGGKGVADVPFYNVTLEIYNFLKTGKFAQYEAFMTKEAA